MKKEIEIIKEIWSEEKEFNLRDKLSLCAAARIIMERLSKDNFGIKLSKKVKEKSKMNLAFQEISLNLHDKPTINDKNYVFSLLVELIIFLDKNNVFKNYLKNINIYKEELKWSNHGKKINYEGLIISRKNPKTFYDNYYIYEVSFLKEGTDAYFQKTKRFFYSKYFMSIHSMYKFQYIKSKLIDNENISRDFILDKPAITIDTSYIQMENFKKYIQRFYIKNNISFIDYMFIQDKKRIDIKDDIWVKELIDIIKINNISKNNMNKILFPLKYLYWSKNKKNDTKWPTWKYEYWTKHLKGGSFNLKEKEILFHLVSHFQNEDQKMNELFSLELIKKGKYFKEIEDDKTIIEKFPGNNKFNSKFNEKKIIKMKFSNNDFITTIEKEQIFSQWENIKNLKFNFEKRENRNPKIKKILNNNYTLIIGQAGSGKTTLIKELIKYYKENNISYIYLAPTHKAKNILENELNMENVKTSTIAQFKSDSKKNQLDEIKELIVDEISMINDEDWISLFKIINLEKIINFIMVGDDKQLKPINSVGFSNIMINDIGVPNRNKILLSENKRQIAQKHKDMVSYVRKNGRIKNVDVEIIKKFNNFNQFQLLAKEFQEYDFITPIHYGLYGTRNISKLLIKNYKEFKKDDSIIIHDDSINDKDLKKVIWKNKKMIIKEVLKQGNISVIKFKNKIPQNDIFSNEIDGWKIIDAFIEFKYEDNNDLPFSHSKSITIHSSQGSTINNLVFVIPPFYKFENNNIFYTAISRFKKNIKIFVYNEDCKNIIDA